MLVQIACVLLGNGSERVLRGSPERIASSLQSANEKFGESIIVVEKSGHVCSRHAEDKLWMSFVADARVSGYEIFTHSMHGVWRREVFKSSASWHQFLDLSIVFHFKESDPQIIKSFSADGSDGWKNPPKLLL